MHDYYNEGERAQGVKERFEARKHLRLPDTTTKHTHGKEYHFTHSWSSDGQKFINNKIDYYDGKLYFFHHGYLFQSNEDGSALKVLIKIAQYFTTETIVNVDVSTVFLSVNSSGIYLYQHGANLSLVQFTLEGTLIAKTTIKGNVSQVYVAENYVFFARTQANQQVCYYNCLTKKEIAVMQASNVLELYGDGTKMLFHLAFERVRGGKPVYDEGWYLHQFDSKATTCITSRNCPPDFVFSKPNAYLPGKAQFIDFKDEFTIRAVDLARDLIWVATPYKERIGNGVISQEYWEPFTLSTTPEPVLDAPIWRMSTQQFVAGSKTTQLLGASYFDGLHFLNGRSIHFMKSFDIEGALTPLGEPCPRAACHNFRVLNNYAYGNFQGTDWQQYAIGEHSLTFVRDCDFGENAPASAQVRKLIVAFNNP